MTRRKSKSNNPAGRPVTVDASASYLWKLSPDLLERGRRAAAQEGVSFAEWLRRLAIKELKRTSR